MAYDGLVNYTIVSELKEHIINGKIDKIYEPNFDEIILGIYSNGIKYALNLVINPGYYRANLTTNAKPNPNQAPNFCMALRKYLVGSHITNIYTKGLERIIFIEIEGYNRSKDFSSKKLVVELMGKHSNIVLLDNQDVIIDSLKHFSINSGSYRDIFAGAKYVLPQSDKLDFMDIKDKEEFYRVLENNGKKINSNSLISILSNNFTGISKSSVKSFEIELSIDDELCQSSSDALYEYINKIMHRTSPVICKMYGKDYGLALFNSNSTKKEDQQLLDFGSSSITQETDNFKLCVNFFLDDYYTLKETNATFINYRDTLLKLILNRLSKLNSKLDEVNNKISECKDAEKLKLYGELITSNLYRIDDYNQKSITLENYYDNNSPLTIPLDESVSPSANAKKFFKRYKKLKTAKEFVDSQKESLVNDIDYFEEVVNEINKCKNIFELDKIYDKLENSSVISKKKSNSGKASNKLKIQHSKTNKSSSISSSKNTNSKSGLGEPLKFEIDGFTVLVGKNNKQNDYLTTKLANKDDIWFHVKEFHGSHVILRTDNKTPTQETINKCAALAKEHSKANMASNIVVDYTFVKYVKKPSGSAPGMVIYTNNKSVTVK